MEAVESRADPRQSAECFSKSSDALKEVIKKSTPAYFSCVNILTDAMVSAHDQMQKDLESIKSERNNIELHLKSCNDYPSIEESIACFEKQVCYFTKRVSFNLFS